MNINQIKYPTRCNLCGGIVRYGSNAEIYGTEYGSGKCYICSSCGAYVGTHKPRPKEALGLLANAEMRNAKRICHDRFDRLWKEKKHARKKRDRLYQRMAEIMDIPLEMCHFGYFDMDMLRKAYLAIVQIEKSNIE